MVTVKALPFPVDILAIHDHLRYHRYDLHRLAVFAKGRSIILVKVQTRQSLLELANAVRLGDYSAETEFLVI